MLIRLWKSGWKIISFTNFEAIFLFTFVTMEQRKSVVNRVGYKSRNFVNSELGTELGKVPPKAIEIEEVIGCINA